MLFVSVVLFCFLLLFLFLCGSVVFYWQTTTSDSFNCVSEYLLFPFVGLRGPKQMEEGLILSGLLLVALTVRETNSGACCLNMYVCSI